MGTTRSIDLFASGSRLTGEVTVRLDASGSRASYTISPEMACKISMELSMLVRDSCGTVFARVPKPGRKPEVVAISDLVATRWALRLAVAVGECWTRWSPDLSEPVDPLPRKRARRKADR